MCIKDSMLQEPKRQDLEEEQDDDEDGSEAQAWLERRLEGLCQDHFEGGLRIFCTSNLSAPEAFSDVWYTISLDSDLSDGEPLMNEEDSARLHTILVFSNQHNKKEVKRLLDIITNIDVHGNDVPPMFWVPHSKAVVKRDQNSSHFVEQELAADLLHRGLDGIVSGEPEGQRLAIAVRSKILKCARLSHHLTGMITETRAQGQYAQYLQHCMHSTLWDYVRARLAPEIPPVDNSLESGEPQELPGYCVSNKLGQGMFGSVYKLIGKPDAGTGVEVIKVVPTEGINDIKDLKYLNRMIHVMNLLSDERYKHPNIIRLFQTYHTPTHILFRLEYGGPENLYRRLSHRQAPQADKMRPLPPEKAARIITQLVDAVVHLHTVVQVCHRDIKPENIIVNETPESIDVKLADFDLAVILREESKTCQSPCGTLPFTAPEVLLDGPYDGCGADIWSLGVVFTEVFCGVRTVELAIGFEGPQGGAGRDNSSLANSIRAYFCRPSAVADLLEDRCLKELRALLAGATGMLGGMLEVDPGQRIEADEVRSVVEQGLEQRAPVAPVGPAPGRRRPAAGGARKAPAGG